MQIARPAIIPVVCVVCLVVGTYLVLEADKRWERERLGLPFELKDNIETEPKSQDDGFSPRNTQRISRENKKVDDPTPTPEKPVPETTEKELSNGELSSESARFIPKKTSTKPSFAKPTTVPAEASRIIEENGIAQKPIQSTAIPVGKMSRKADSPIPEDPKSNQTAEIALDALSLDRATNSIVSFSRADGSFLGCGVIVSTFENGFDVLSANHLFSTLEPFSIATFDRDSRTGALVPRTHRSAKILKQSSAMDLAIVRVHTLIVPKEMLRLAESGTVTAETNLKGWAVYCDEKKIPQSEAVTIASRQTARRNKESPLVSYWKIERPSAPGLSGSALIDPRGHLIGIASGNSNGIAYYCDENELAKFLKE